MATIKGTIYFASLDAQRKRHYREGAHVTLDHYHSARFLTAEFVSVDLDATGTNYLHVSITPCKHHWVEDSAKHFVCSACGKETTV